MAERCWERLACRLVRCQVGAMVGVSQGVTFCTIPLKAWQRWKSSTSCVRWPAPICHSLQLVSAWPSQTDSLLCREKNGKEIKLLCSLYIYIHQPLTTTQPLVIDTVSCVRSLTLEKEPLHSHWLQKPAVRKETEEKTLKETVNKEEPFNPHHHSHLRYHATLQLWRKSESPHWFGRISHWQLSLLPPPNEYKGSFFDTYLRIQPQDLSDSGI